MTTTTASEQITRQDMIAQVTDSLTEDGHVDGFDIPGVVDDLISTHGLVDINDVPFARYMQAFASHQRREYWR